MSHADDMVQYELVKGELMDRHDFESREKAMAYRKMIDETKWTKDTPEVKELFNKMKANNSILDATLHVYTYGLEPDEEGKIDSTRYETAFKTTKTAYDMGVKIGAGSDDMIGEDGFTINIHNEIHLLVEAGLSNIDAIRAATIVNAEGLGEEKNIGSIEKGKLANMVILNSDPLVNISSTSDIKYVVKRGKVVE